MTTATKMLRQEHEAILRMLDATEEVAGRLERGASVAPDILSGLLEFFQLFADRCHHGKEEDLLFPALAQKGLPTSGGPIAVMLHEHALGRSLIGRMEEAGMAYGSDASAGPRWAEAAAGYASLLRAHIQKENNVLFVMAENLLSQSEQQELSEAFERIEVEKMGPGTHERLHAVMEKIIRDVFPQTVSRS
jgi:hemerythrin-like domain-containing protein